MSDVCLDTPLAALMSAGAFPHNDPPELARVPVCKPVEHSFSYRKSDGTYLELGLMPQVSRQVGQQFRVSSMYYRFPDSLSPQQRTDVAQALVARLGLAPTRVKDVFVAQAAGDYEVRLFQGFGGVRLVSIYGGDDAAQGLWSSKPTAEQRRRRELVATRNRAIQEQPGCTAPNVPRL